MERIENHCVGCADGLGCMGSACPNRNVRVIYCDSCGEEINIDDVYEADGDELCEDCLKDRFRKGG
jgi:hypothetical protein